jgi:hypothetical protein
MIRKGKVGKKAYARTSSLIMGRTGSGTIYGMHVWAGHGLSLAFLALLYLTNHSTN